MPIATKNSSIHELSHQISTLHFDNNDDITCEVPTIDESLFEEIRQLIEKASLYEREEEDAKKAAEQIDRTIENAKETLSRAQEKRDALVKRSRYFEGKLLDQQNNIRLAVDYWKDYGVDVKQVHQDGDSYEQYEFIFANLDRRRKRKKSTGQLTQPTNGQSGQKDPTQQEANNTPNTKDQQFACSVSLKYHEQKLEVVGQVPEILSTESLSNLNEKLTHHCINQSNGKVNYRSAMTLIRKDLIKDAPSPKTWSHPPAETNTHTCTSPPDPSSAS